MMMLIRPFFIGTTLVVVAILNYVISFITINGSRGGSISTITSIRVTMTSTMIISIICITVLLLPHVNSCSILLYGPFRTTMDLPKCAHSLLYLSSFPLFLSFPHFCDITALSFFTIRKTKKKIFTSAQCLSVTPTARSWKSHFWIFCLKRIL